MITAIPFSGFYNSVHDDALDQAFNRCFSDSSGRENSRLCEPAFWHVNWAAAHAQYAAHYAAAWCVRFGIVGAEFDALQSPREYNFTTDRIFIDIPSAEFARILGITPRPVLDTAAREMFTSRSGFVSFYSADVDEWGPPDEWDHNQAAAVVDAYARHVLQGGEFGPWEELELMESAQCNGRLDEWIFTGAAPELARLDRIGAYLRQREERAYRIEA